MSDTLAGAGVPVTKSAVSAARRRHKTPEQLWYVTVARDNPG